ncbi:MAG: prepilin-type N-terminal cleavage/methylation domain-containing protein [Thermacetogeniaceae bacterium]
MIDLKKYVRNEKGFTLVEMMVVLIIIAVLIAGGIRFYIGYIGRAKITKATADITTMQAALDSYYAQANAGSNAYPAGDDASLTAAGLSTELVGNAAVTTAGSARKYQYKPDGTNSGYEINTITSLDGSNYVVGTGLAGKSGPSETTATIPDAP